MDDEKQSTNLPTSQTAPTGVTPSAGGPNGPFPEELRGWNWGAFFLNWIWAIGNSVWIGLLALLGPIALIMAIILGIKGNEWAWQNRKFESVEQFKKVQKAWAIWGLVLFLISIIFFFVFVMKIITINMDASKQKSIEAQQAAAENQRQINAAIQTENAMTSSAPTTLPVK